MNIIIGIILSISIGIGIGFLLAKSTRPAHRGATRERMQTLRHESHEALTKRTQKRKARIMALAQKQGKIVNDDVEDMFCISDSTAYRYLEELEQEGKLTSQGTGKGTFYIPHAE